MSKVAFSISRVHTGNLRSPNVTQFKNRRKRMRRRRRRKKFTETVIHSKCFNYSHENRTGQWYGVDLIVRQESSFSQSLDAFAVKSRSSGGALPVYRFVPKRCADCILTIAPCSGMYQQCPGTMYPAISCTNSRKNYLLKKIYFLNVYISKCSTFPSTLLGQVPCPLPRCHSKTHFQKVSVLVQSRKRCYTMYIS